MKLFSSSGIGTKWRYSWEDEKFVWWYSWQQWWEDNFAESHMNYLFLKIRPFDIHHGPEKNYRFLFLPKEFVRLFVVLYRLLLVGTYLHGIELLNCDFCHGWWIYLFKIRSIQYLLLINKKYKISFTHMFLFIWHIFLHIISQCFFLDCPKMLFYA